MPITWIAGLVLSIIVTSQIYWMLRVRALARKLIRSKTTRIWLAPIGLVLNFLLMGVNMGWFGQGPSPTRMTLYDALLAAPFRWWIASSLVAFLLVMIFWL